MHVQDVRVAELREADYNPRSISEHDLESLRRSMRQYGVVQPIIANKRKGRENVVVGGHQRLRVLKELGHETVPVVYVDLDEGRERALNVALNRITGDFEDRPLALLVQSLRDDDEALRLTGLHEEELAGILALGVLGPPPVPQEYGESGPKDDPTVQCPKCDFEFIP